MSVASRERAEYDVALSFAGEDRAYVEAVAEYLRDGANNWKAKSRPLIGRERLSVLQRVASLLEADA
jgi:hypothetical protein